MPLPVPSDSLPLEDLVRNADVRLDGNPAGAILRVTGDPPKVHALCLTADHPLDVLLGFTAPISWRGIGLHCKGRGYDLHDPRKARPPGRCTNFVSEALDAVPVTVTILIDRTGSGEGLLRDGEIVRRLSGLPEGAVGDACRRALGLPTAAPPPNTVPVWLRVWLDRIVEVGVYAEHRGNFTWDVVARLHSGVPGLSQTCEPEAVAEATRAMAEAWPWDRLRRDPEVVDTAQPPLERNLAQWMDDGMFARWLLAEMIDLRLLAKSARTFLDPSVMAQIAETFTLCDQTLPDAEVVR